MPADELCERLRVEAGVEVGVRTMVDAAGSAPDRLRVLLPPVALAEQDGWRVRERSAYADALAEARVTVPTVTLASTPFDDLLPASSEGRLLAGVHEALTELLGLPDADDALCADVAGAVAQLETARRLLRGHDAP